MARPLFSERNGRGRGFSFSDLAGQVWESMYYWIYEQGLLDEAFGYDVNSWLTDEVEKNRYFKGYISNPTSYFTRRLRYKVDFTYSSTGDGGFKNTRASNSTPPFSLQVDSDKFFDFLELIHDLCSLPVRRSNARKHIGFNKKNGQKLFRDSINQDLALYENPLIMLSNGQIVELSNKPVLEMAEDALKLSADLSIKATTIEPVHEAVQNYLARGASTADKKQAVRELAGVLESIRSLVKQSLLSADEKELFKIANEFAVRHNNSKQKGDYDKSIWYDWMFQVNLAAVLTVVKIVQAQNGNKIGPK